MFLDPRCVQPRLAVRVLATALTIMSAASAVVSAAGALNAFTRAWDGRRVVVRSPLYSVLYDEVGRLGKHYPGKLAGLTVATHAGQHYEFDGPGSDEDIAAATPHEVMNQMSARFHRSSHLELSSVKTITPRVLRQFDPGVTLIVDSVRVERNRIRFEFVQSGDGDDGFATSLTIEWPAPLSKELREREAIEAMLRRFVEPA
jgi:hypothetical protein